MQVIADELEKIQEVMQSLGQEWEVKKFGLVSWESPMADIPTNWTRQAKLLISVPKP